MSRVKWCGFLLMVALLSATLFLAPKKTFAASGIESQLSFEGKVSTTSTGVNITNGTYNMEFKIYSGGTSTGGGTLVWTEDWLVNNSQGVTFNGGTFEANLGSICSFSGGSCETYTNTAVNWNSYPLYLSVQIGGTSGCTVTTSFASSCGGDGEMTPYILLTSTPYSFNSGQLGGLTASQFVQTNAANVIQPTATNVTGLTVAQSQYSGTTADIFDVDSYVSSTNTPVLQVTSGANINLYGGSGSSITIGSQTASTANNIYLGASGSTTNSDNIYLDYTSGAEAGNIYIGGTAQTGTIALGQSASTNTINIGAAAGAGNTQTINVGNSTTGSSTTNVAIGSTTGTSTTTIQGITIGLGTSGNTTFNLATATTGTLTIGNTSTTSTTIQGGTGSSAVSIQSGASGTISVGSTANNTLNLGTGVVAGTITIGGSTQTGTISLGQSTAANTINIGNGNLTSAAQTINIGTGATGSGSDIIAIGSTVAGTISLESPNVYIGTAGINTTPSLLNLDTASTFTESVSCTTTTNEGAMYYNTSTNSIRSCVNGSWQDMVSQASLALQLFGVVPNSGTNPGDLIGASATATVQSNTGGPCKVNWAATAYVYVNSCLAYSGGRLVSVPATLLSTSGIAASSYQNICLTSSGVPALLGSASTTMTGATLNNLTTTNAVTIGQPLLCLATVKTSTTAGSVALIYDTRTFTTTTKAYATETTANNAFLGAVMTPSGATVAASTTQTSNVLGVVVAYTGTTSTAGAPNLILATAGPQWIAAVTTGNVLNDFIVPSGTTAGLAQGSYAELGGYNDVLGINLSTYETSCTSQLYGVTDCNASLFAYMTVD